MSYKSHRVAPARAFDHLYDPLYTTSSVQNIYKENYNALSRTAPMHIVPVYNTMFTDMPSHPRNYYTLQQNPLPTQPTYNPAAQRQIPPTNVSGMDRAKFFAIPMEDQKTKHINLNINFEVDSDRSPENADADEDGPKDIGCQTIYRESSAQTRPWMPEGVLPAKTTESEESLEIVHIAHLLEGDNEPGVLEVEVVERARRRRAWERSLPPMRSARDWMKRKSILEAFEWEEWVARENQIDELQEMKMAYIQHMTQEQKRNWSRFAGDTQIAEDEKIKEKYDRKMAQICAKYQRKLRKLEREGNNIPRKYKKADIIDEYTNKASDSYAPITRFGSHPRQSHFQPGETPYKSYVGNFDQLFVGLRNVQRFIDQRPKLTDPKKPYSVLDSLSEGYFKQLYSALKDLKATKVQYSENKFRKAQMSFIENDSSIKDVREYIKQERKNVQSMAAFMRAGNVPQPANPEVCQEMVSILDEIITKLLDERKSHALLMLVEQKKKPSENAESLSSSLLVENYLENILMFQKDGFGEEQFNEESRKKLKQLATDLNEKANLMLKTDSITSNQSIGKMEICNDIVEELIQELQISESPSVDDDCMNWANEIIPIISKKSPIQSEKSIKSKSSFKSIRSEEEKVQLSVILKEVEENLSEFAEDDSDYQEQLEQDYISE